MSNSFPSRLLTQGLVGPPAPAPCVGALPASCSHTHTHTHGMMTGVPRGAEDTQVLRERAAEMESTSSRQGLSLTHTHTHTHTHSLMGKRTQIRHAGPGPIHY